MDIIFAVTEKMFSWTWNQANLNWNLLVFKSGLDSKDLVNFSHVIQVEAEHFCYFTPRRYFQWATREKMEGQK